MKKTFFSSSIFFLFLLLASCFSNAKTTLALRDGTCECYTAGGDILFTNNCASECPEHCRDVGTTSEGRTMPVLSCVDTTDPSFRGMKECVCGFTVSGVSEDECVDGCYPFARRWSASIVDLGDTCASQEDCNGTDGFCIESRCFCDMTARICRSKFDIGTPCQDAYQCNSNVCSDSGLPEKRCVAGTPGAPGEEPAPPQPTESELFPTYNLNSPIGQVSGPGLIGRIIKTVLGIVGALALAMFIYGGFTWLTSGGSADKIKKGKDILMWAAIGLVVIFSSYTLVDFLLKSFGL